MVKFFAIAGFAGVLFAAQPALSAPCCDQAGHQHDKACCDMPCCQDQAKVEAATPVRQETVVWLKRPTLIGKAILMGQYVIQHDNDRMARGEPCTHIYANNDRVTPVAAFHCKHIERARASENVVVVVNTADPGLQRLTEFQFSGETGAHGYPNIR
jgi:hypothetical protein